MITPLISMRKARARRLQALKDREERSKDRKNIYAPASTATRKKIIGEDRGKRDLLQHRRPVTNDQPTASAVIPSMSTRTQTRASRPTRPRFIHLDSDIENEKPAKTADISSEALIRYGGGRPPKAAGDVSVLPKALAGLTKVPYEDRVNPLIDPNSDEFVEKEKEFLSLLRHEELTLRQILQSCFTDHEVSLLTPMSEPPELVEWQKDNTLRYNRLLQTSFKDKQSTTQLKMAMTYFGLPVAPLKMGRIQSVTPLDVDFLEDQTIFQADPLEFLDDYTERSWGNPNLRKRRQHFPKLMPTQRFTSLTYASNEIMGLRGGSLEIKTASTLYYASAKDGSPAPPTLFRVMGYQGVVHCHTGDYLDFVSAVDRILGFKYKYDYEISASFYGTDANGRKTNAGGTEVEGTINHTAAPSGCPIWAAATKFFGEAGEGQKFDVFVHYKGETPSRTRVPSEVEALNTLRLINSQNGDVAYMKVPEPLRKHHRPHQYTEQFSKAMRLLFPKPPLLDFKWWVRSQSGTAIRLNEKSFGYLDPPTQLWEAVVQDIEENDLYNGDITMTDIYLEGVEAYTGLVPIVVPGYYPESRDNKGIPKDEFKTHGDDGRDFKNLVHVTEAVLEVVPHLRLYEKSVSLEIWIPGEWVLEKARIPFNIGSVNTQTASMAAGALADWRRVVHNFETRTYDEKPKPNVSIVARPVYQTYKVYNRDTQTNIELDINNVSRAEFVKAVAEGLFPGLMDPVTMWSTDKKCLRLWNATWSGSLVDSVIRASTTDDEWSWIVRHITQPDIAVTIEDWDVRWRLISIHRFGPRYDHATVQKLAPLRSAKTGSGNPGAGKAETGKAEPAKTGQNKPNTTNTTNTATSRASQNAQTAAGRSHMLRERLFWQTPQIYADPQKPTMPIHAPPLEHVVRTGRRMPGVVTGMRTPSEVGRLQKQVHSLRHDLLDRSWQCPYAGCTAGPFEVSNPAAIDWHMRVEHHTLKCFMCDDLNNLIPYYEPEAMRDHFLECHGTEFKELFCGSEITGTDQPPIGQPSLRDLLSVNALDTINDNKLMLFHFCDRCGRDQFLLNNTADRQHHDKVCQKLDRKDSEQKYSRPLLCKFCGESRVTKARSAEYEPCACGQSPKNLFDPGNFCPTCGLKYDGQKPPMDQHYREIHERNCKKYSGGMWDHCGFCAIRLQGSGDLGKRKHVHWCEKRPTMGPRKCPLPSCGERLLSAEQAKKHVETHGNSEACPFCNVTFVPLTPEMRHIHLALHLYNFSASPGVDPAKPATGNVPSGMAPTGGPSAGVPAGVPPAIGVSTGATDIAANTDESEAEAQAGKLPTTHAASSVHINDTDARVANILERLKQVKKGRTLTPAAPAPAPAPTSASTASKRKWRPLRADEHTPRQRHSSPYWDEDDSDYEPPPDARCSRCFRAAGFDKTWIKAHTHEDGACGIRNRKVTPLEAEQVGLPNRSGWIEEARRVDFTSYFEKFVRKYPAYRFTMFPAVDDPKRVDEVYYDENSNIKHLYGTHEEDPNYRGKESVYMTYDCDSLPWPPYEGTAIPITSQDKQATRARAASSWKPGLYQGVSNNSDYKKPKTTGGFIRPRAEGKTNAKTVRPRQLPDVVQKGIHIPKPSGVTSSNVNGKGFIKKTTSANGTGKGFIRNKRLDGVPKKNYAESSASSLSITEEEDKEEVEGGIMPTSTGTDTDEWIDRVTRGSYKRKRDSLELDSLYQPPNSAELIEPEEEQSEADAVPETPSNLRPDAPRTPTKRSSAKKKGGSRSRASKTPATASWPKTASSGRKTPAAPTNDWPEVPTMPEGFSPVRVVKEPTTPPPAATPSPRTPKKAKLDKGASTGVSTRSSSRRRTLSAKAAAANGF